MNVTVEYTDDGRVESYGKYFYILKFGTLYRRTKRTFTGTKTLSQDRKEQGILEALEAWEKETQDKADAYKEMKAKSDAYLEALRRRI